jgi:hypothetical protein
LANGTTLTDAMRTARLAEAAHSEAVLNLRDAKALRLQLLKDELMPLVASNPDAAAFFELAISPGEPPKLWIDMISQVVMEPDQRTYRLIQDTRTGRELLFETADPAEMADRLKVHFAHRLVARERDMARATPARVPGPGYSSSSVMFAWITGFAVGALTLFMAAIALGRLKF